MTEEKPYVIAEPGYGARVTVQRTEWARRSNGRWAPLGHAGGYPWDVLVRLFPDYRIDYPSTAWAKDGPYADAASRESPLWSMLDWTLWGAGLIDTFREPLADRMIAVLTDDEREQIVMIAESRKHRRGAMVGQVAYDDLRGQLDAALATLNAVTTTITDLCDDVENDNGEPLIATATLRAAVPATSHGPLRIDQAVKIIEDAETPQDGVLALLRALREDTAS